MADVACYQGAVELIRHRLKDSLSLNQEMMKAECIEKAGIIANAMVEALRNGGKILFFGNGGSSMDAGHLAAELAGRFYRNRPGLAGLSLADGTASVTAIANDFSYDDVFARQVRALGRAGDVAVGLTTSGNSSNVLEALKAAHEMRLFTAALTGRAGGKVAAAVDVCVQVPSDDTPRIQEACLHLGHSICEIVERDIFPEQ